MHAHTTVFNWECAILLYLQFVFTVVDLVMEDSFFQVQMSDYVHAGTNVPHSACACCFSCYFSSTYSYCHPLPSQSSCLQLWDCFWISTSLVHHSYCMPSLPLHHWYIDLTAFISQEAFHLLNVSESVTATSCVVWHWKGSTQQLPDCLVNKLFGYRVHTTHATHACTRNYAFLFIFYILYI